MPVQPTQACLDALPHVVDFARRLGADLSGVGARAPIFLTDPWLVGGEMIQQIADDEETQLKAAEDHFLAAAQGLNGHAHWQVHRDYPNKVLNDIAAGADLIVVPLDKGPEAFTVALPSLVLEAGIPVLMLPNPGTKIRTQNIMVAWRNTADARRAVSAALPLLEQAQAVTVVQVVRSKDADEAWVGLGAVRDRLERHGVKTEVNLVFNEEEGDSDTLLNAAAERSADIIVMGGYGHMRAREWLLGGMTQDLIGSSNIPLFMVH